LPVVSPRRGSDARLDFATVAEQVDRETGEIRTDSVKNPKGVVYFTIVSTPPVAIRPE
jgi:hypothetical protein